MGLVPAPIVLAGLFGFSEPFCLVGFFSVTWMVLATSQVVGRTLSILPQHTFFFFFHADNNHQNTNENRWVDTSWGKVHVMKIRGTST